MSMQQQGYGAITDLTEIGLILAVCGVALVAGLVVVPIVAITAGVSAAFRANQPK